MTNPIADMFQSKTARIAVLLYLLIAVSAGFAQYFRSSVIVSGDATATVHNITASPWLFESIPARSLIVLVF